MATIQPKFVWFEHVTRDAAASQRFYGEVFGWKVQPFDMGGQSYPMIAAGGVPIGGWTGEDAGATARWEAYLSVIDVDKSLAAVTAAGGKVLKPAFDVPGVSRMAQVADPTGGVFWIMQSKGNEDDHAPKPGEFNWNELWTGDPAKAAAFYTQAFGFGREEMNMGPMGTYHVLKTGAESRGGILKMEGATQWVPYVTVDDCDATVTRAAKLGAKTLVPPSDIPGIGRYAVLTDPQGARVALIKPAAR